ncbi:MAG: hypothetical protein BWY83_01983 [bacterium ADurb.Bin478]|nr:MAG: hypothetical protein BWY83_01983 [bacterium ADurb.Bin478]
MPEGSSSVTLTLLRLGVAWISVCSPMYCRVEISPASAPLGEKILLLERNNPDREVETRIESLPLATSGAGSRLFKSSGATMI